MVVSRWASRSLEWKTFSVEAGDGFSKPVPADVLQMLKPKAGEPNRSRFVNEMQKHGLTMFPLNCYSSLVPRVNLGLLYAASPRVGVCGDLRLGF
jgi:hypothetical protein